MKVIKFAVTTVLIVGFGIIAQAQTVYSVDAMNARVNPFLNLLSPVDVSVSQGCPDANQLTAAEMSEIVKIHNQVRATVGTAPLKWNCDLAKFSQNWANADTFEHSTQEQRGQIISGGTAGENLAIDSGSMALMSDLNKGWIDERQFWNNDANTCAADKVCGHYTQMVWKTTSEVGCGIIRSSKKLGEEFRASYLVCTYYPSGNVAGEKPY